MKTTTKVSCKLTLLLLIVFIGRISASNYYWVGNSGNWSDINHWATTSGGGTLFGVIPSANDNVFFDANSFSNAGQTVTVDVPAATCADMDWTGVAGNPTLAGSSSNTLQIYGSLTFTPNMVLSFIGPVSFEATTMGQTITSAGHSFHNSITFNGVGGGWTLQDALTTSGTWIPFNPSPDYTIYLNNGAIKRKMLVFPILALKGKVLRKNFG
jgi:hypothetical protein